MWEEPALYRAVEQVRSDENVYVRALSTGADIWYIHNKYFFTNSFLPLSGTFQFKGECERYCLDGQNMPRLGYFLKLQTLQLGSLVVVLFQIESVTIFFLWDK